MNSLLWRWGPLLGARYFSKLAKPIDDIVEGFGFSSEVLATLFDLEMKGIVRQLPGKQFGKILL